MLARRLLAASSAKKVPEYISSTILVSPYSGGAHNFVVSKPSNVSEGNLLIALCNSNGAGYTVTSGGWTVQNKTTRINLAYKIATASEPESYTFYFNGGGNETVSIHNIKNGVMSVIGTVASGVNPTAPSITVPTDNSFGFVGLAMVASNDGSTVPINVPGWIGRTNRSPSPAQGVFTKILNPGATGGVAVTTTDQSYPSSSAFAFLVAVKGK